MLDQLAHRGGGERVARPEMIEPPQLELPWSSPRKRPTEAIAGNGQEMEPHLVLDDETDHAKRRAAQSVRVLRSGRLLVDHPEADEHVELVGERDRNAHPVARHPV